MAQIVDKNFAAEILRMKKEYRCAYKYDSKINIVREKEYKKK